MYGIDHLHSDAKLVNDKLGQLGVEGKYLVEARSRYSKVSLDWHSPTGPNYQVHFGTARECCDKLYRDAFLKL